MSVERIGRYQIIGELGRGAMGVVYKATDPTIGRTVALKTMRLDVHAEKHDQMLSRFQNEARAAGALNHPNIVTIFDAAEVDGIFYIAMEYIEGTTLSQLLHDRRSISAQEVVEIGSQICAGLQYAHFRKVIHRDIKPPNIMLAANGVVKIMDFGIAKAGASVTNTGEVLGTPHYMSPEQVKGLDLDGRSDIFSTGVVLYEMTTGEKPFAGQNVTSIIYKIVNEDPVPPRELDVTIHPGMSMVVTKCLAKDPDDRYQEASDLATALKSYKIVSIPQKFTTTGTQPVDPPPGAIDTRNAVPQQSTQVLTQPLPTQPLPPRPVAPPAVATTSMRAAAAPKTAPIIPVAPPELPTPEARSKSQRQKTVTLFAALAALLLVGAFAIRMMRQPSSSPAQPPASVVATPQSASEPRPESQLAQSPAQASAKPEKPASSSGDWTRVSAPAATAPVASGVGDLRVTSNPAGAQVVIDGTAQAYYVTPFNTPPLEAGTHTLVVTAPGLPPQTRQVQVTPRKRTIVDFQLAGDKAIYNIASAPQGAEVMIDGVSSGAHTPAQLMLTAGTHKILLRMEGFSPVELVTQSAPGESVNISPRLQAKNSVDISEQVAAETPSLGAAARMRRPENYGGMPEGKGAVVIRTRPKGVTIVVDGFTVPRATPFRFPIRAGSHTVVLQRPGFQSVTRTIQVEEGKVIELDEILLPQ